MSQTKICDNSIYTNFHDNSTFLRHSQSQFLHCFCLTNHFYSLQLTFINMLRTLYSRSAIRSIKPVMAPRFQFRSMSTPHGKVQEITTMAEFKKLVDNPDKVTVIDYYATWCGPCKALEPIFAMLSERIPEVQFGRVDVDQAQDVAMEYAVSAMPTCILFKDGEKLDTIVGANPPKLVKLITEHSGVDITGR